VKSDLDNSDSYRKSLLDGHLVFAAPVLSQLKPFRVLSSAKLADRKSKEFDNIQLEDEHIKDIIWLHDEAS